MQVLLNFVSLCQRGFPCHSGKQRRMNCYAKRTSFDVGVTFLLHCVLHVLLYVVGMIFAVLYDVPC